MSRCGCTIHEDRGEPCRNAAQICVPCERECWGFVDPGAALANRIRHVLKNPATFHDAGEITNALLFDLAEYEREWSNLRRGTSPLRSDEKGVS